MLRGKSFEDRAGCSLLVELLHDEPYPVDVLAAFTVQEETAGLRGAKVAAQTLQPDVAFVLEGTTANDVPILNANPDDDVAHNPTCKCRRSVQRHGSQHDRQPAPVRFHARNSASRRHPLPDQDAVGGGTYGRGAIHMANAGVATGVISLPCRYIHSPTAYLHRDDDDNALRLIKALLRAHPAGEFSV